MIFSGSSNKSEINTTSPRFFIRSAILCSTPLKLENHLPLGTYQMELIDMTGRDEVLAEHTFQLQEFKAPRHFTGISFIKESAKKVHNNQWTEASDTLKVTINGNYYSGGHVKNGQVRWKIFHGPTNYNVKEIGDFVFGNLAEEKFLLESSESILDDNGSLSLSFPIDPKVRQGKRSLVVVATTIDFDGRVATTKSIYQERVSYVVGIKGAKKKIKSGDELSLKLLVADPNRNPVQEGAQETPGTLGPRRTLLGHFVMAGVSVEKSAEKTGKVSEECRD